MCSVHKLRYLMVKTEGFSLFSPCNLADSAFPFLIVIFTISENMTLKILSLIFFSHKESSIYLLLGIQMCASCFKLKMASLLITEKVYKITHFEILALQTLFPSVYKAYTSQWHFVARFWVLIKAGLWAIVFFSFFFLPNQQFSFEYGYALAFTFKLNIK